MQKEIFWENKSKSQMAVPCWILTMTLVPAFSVKLSSSINTRYLRLIIATNLQLTALLTCVIVTISQLAITRS